MSFQEADVFMRQPHELYVLCYSCISSSGMSADMKLSTGTEDVVEKTDRKEQNV